MNELADAMIEQDRLARAAPALLISLRQMLAWVQARVEPGVSGQALYPLLRAEIKAAQAAIAAAEGREP